MARKGVRLCLVGCHAGNLVQEVGELGTGAAARDETLQFIGENALNINNAGSSVFDRKVLTELSFCGQVLSESKRAAEVLTFRWV
ncbi:hypothetical protein GCM10028799_34760 [Kribbella italica]